MHAFLAGLLAVLFAALGVAQERKVQIEIGDPPSGEAPPSVSEPKITWKGPLPDSIDPTAADHLPHDVRHRSLGRARLERLDEAYPWLTPTAPSLWVSLSLLLAIAASLVVHLSVQVSGAEVASLGRSVGVALWYLATGLVQFVAVPCNNLSVVLMLLGNSTLALFWLSLLFGLTRSAATIALVVQLGFVVLGYGALELVTALLGSIGAPAV